MHDYSTRKAIDVIVKGRVQGVGFRQFVRIYATQLGLKGYVMNQPDGSVRAVIEGSSRGIADMKALLKEGPAMARVDHVAVDEIQAEGEFKAFEIR